MTLAPHAAADATLTAMAPVVDPASVTIGVAIALPEPCASAVRDARERFGDPQARAIPTHVTLLAPTMVPPTMLKGIDAHLRDAAAHVQPFRLSVNGTGTFRPVSPVVFLSVNEGISGCEALERVIRYGPLLRKRNFPYHPHITLVHEVPEAVMDEAFQAFADYRFSYVAEHFTLYMQDAERVWQPVRDYRLG